MEGSLLDPETADTTLAKDWNLPALPEGMCMYEGGQPAACKAQAFHLMPITFVEYTMLALFWP